MISEKKAKLSKFLNSLMAFFKIVLCIFLGIIIFTWLVSIFEIESYVPFYDSLNDFFTNISYIFYTPTKDDDENFNAIMYIVIAIVFFLLIFETITDILGDILKLYEKNKEEALEEENERINQEIQKKYKMHLRTSMRFVVMFKLNIVNPMYNTQAFKDEKMEEALRLQAQKMAKEIFSMITMSVKCQIRSNPEMLTLLIDKAEDLNKILFFIRSICQVEKYVKNGLGYYMAVTTYLATDSNEKAIADAKELIDMKVNKKILCYQIVSECLNLVPENNFKAISNGEYTESEDVIYELVNKN